MNPIKIAILSCNHGHAKGYYSLINDPKFILVGVSIEPEYRGKVFEEKLINIPCYDTDEELYANHQDLEAVIIGSANIKHAEQTIKAAKKGLHIFSMKIPTFNNEEYDLMIEAVDSAGVVCQIELEMRERAEVYRIKELIDAGEIGDVLSVTALNFSHNPVSWRPWQADPEQSYGKKEKLGPEYQLFRGGALADHPHIFDIVPFILGTDFDTVYAEVAPNIRDVETEDLIYIIGKLKNGATFSLDPSYANTENKVSLMYDWVRYPKPVEVNITVHGTKGSIIADVYGKCIYHNGLPDGRYIVNYATYDCGMNRMMEQFYNCIRHGIKPRVSLREHRRTIDVINACYDSLRDQKPIKV